MVVLRFLTRWIYKSDVKKFEFEANLETEDVCSVQEDDDELRSSSSSFTENHQVVLFELYADEGIQEISIL